MRPGPAPHSSLLPPHSSLRRQHHDHATAFQEGGALDLADGADPFRELLQQGAPDLRVRVPPELLRYVVEKGSVTVDGCSLTVVRPLADGFTVAVIPHTLEVTTLGSKGTGDRVNLEVDVVAKYVERLLQQRSE